MNNKVVALKNEPPRPVDPLQDLYTQIIRKAIRLNRLFNSITEEGGQ